MKLIQNSLLVFLIAIAGGAEAHTVQSGQSNSGVQAVAATNNIAANANYAASYDLKFAPVPEPEGWTLYLLGLGFVLYQFRRCRNKSRSWDNHQDKNSIE